jgi:hypothetical protein
MMDDDNGCFKSKINSILKRTVTIPVDDVEVWMDDFSARVYFDLKTPIPGEAVALFTRAATLALGEDFLFKNLCFWETRGGPFDIIRLQLEFKRLEVE